MERLLITQREQVLWTVLFSSKSKRPLQIQLQPLEAAPLLRQVRVARVRDVVKNIHAAFVELGDGMQGFYSLEDNPAHLFAQPRTETASSVFSKRPLRSGDEILVQVEKEAIKTKDPVVTSHIQLSGRFCVLTAGKTGLGISAKISDKEWKTEAKERFLSYLSDDWGFILRTQAREASFEEIEKEMQDLSERFCQLIKKGSYSTCYSVLYQEPPSYLLGLRDLNLQQVAEIVTDLPNVYEKMQETLRLTQPEALSKLRLYQDEQLSLFHLYSLQEGLQKALRKQVWLKSGGYLVIEPTEALTVIDVNTGKYTGKKTAKETIRAINLEAAERIGEELRLRNLSGIILVDFIDMTDDTANEELLLAMRRIVAADPVKTTVVDMTALHLMEITRKKSSRPLHEQAALLFQKSSILKSYEEKE